MRIDDPAVDGRHALLPARSPGDLRRRPPDSRPAPASPDAAAASAWLGAGDILEVAGRRVELLQLRADGSTIDPPLEPAMTFWPMPIHRSLPELTLEPLDFARTALDARVPPWHSSVDGEACAIRIENASASRTHCALFRGFLGCLCDRPPRPPDPGQRAAGRRRLDPPRRRRPDGWPGPIWYSRRSRVEAVDRLCSDESRSARFDDVDSPTVL